MFNLEVFYFLNMKEHHVIIGLEESAVLYLNIELISPFAFEYINAVNHQIQPSYFYDSMHQEKFFCYKLIKSLGFINLISI